LYHRLGVILIHVPPLNERRDDIPDLVTKFLNDIANDYGNKPKTITPDAMAYLQQLDWRGNVRELRNVVERLIIMSGNEITLQDAKDYARPIVA
jgi:two-component system, NtrC family, nitrogen regulation response regulator NtrX